MAYTVPRTWTVGEVLTAANLNTHLRDMMNYLLDSSGEVAVITTDTYFGTYARGAAGGRVHLVGTTGFGKIAAETNTGNADLYVAAQGTGAVHFQTNGGDAVTINSANALAAVGNDHYFGPYAFGSGSNVTRLHLQQISLGEQRISAEGTNADVQLDYNAKGGGSHVWMASGVTKATLSSAGILAAYGSDHYFGTYASGSGSGVGRLHLVGTTGYGKVAAETDTGNADLYLAAQGTGLVHVQTSNADALTIDASFNLAVKGQTNKIGQGALGAAQAFTQIGDDAAGNAIVQAGHGTLANAGLTFKAKGTGSTFLQDGAGTVILQIDNATTFKTLRYPNMAFAIGNGVNTNMQAPLKGTGGGPTSAVLATNWMPVVIQAATYWVPCFT